MISSWSVPNGPFLCVPKIALVYGLFLALSIWLSTRRGGSSFPGLYVSEKRFVVPGVMSASLLFLAGGLFAYMMFPMMFDVLLNQMMPSAVAGSFTIDRVSHRSLHDGRLWRLCSNSRS